jgi:hypothetical protein
LRAAAVRYASVGTGFRWLRNPRTGMNGEGGSGYATVPPGLLPLIFHFRLPARCRRRLCRPGPRLPRGTSPRPCWMRCRSGWSRSASGRSDRVPRGRQATRLSPVHGVHFLRVHVPGARGAGQARSEAVGSRMVGYSRWSESARLGTTKDKRKIGKMLFPPHR